MKSMETPLVDSHFWDFYVGITVVRFAQSYLNRDHLFGEDRVNIPFPSAYCTVCIRTSWLVFSSFFMPFVGCAMIVELLSLAILISTNRGHMLIPQLLLYDFNF